MQSQQADNGAESEQPAQEHHDGSNSSGQGAASALARMKSQHEHRARQKPADEPSQGRKQQ